MTDRVKGLWVSFERDIREDDAQPMIAAIKQFRGVADVQANIANPDDWLNRTQIQMEFRRKIFAALLDD